MNNTHFVGKANTLQYSNGDISAVGTLNISKFEQYIREHPDMIFVDGSGNRHITFKINKLKTPFERWTHVFSLRDNKVINNQNKPKDEEDELPF
jgi:ABC-type Fe3+-hydroxamate transport system substrate-binding protein